MDYWAAGYILHPGSGRLDIISNVLSVITSAGSTPRASRANRFVGFGLGLYVDIRPLLLCYSHGYPFNTTTGTRCTVSADRIESVLSGPSARVYVSCACYSRRHFFLVSSNRAPGTNQVDYWGVVAGCGLFFSDLRGICAV